MMARVATVPIALLIALSFFMTDSLGWGLEQQIFIATTGRIIKINANARTMLVRGSDHHAVVSNWPSGSRQCNVVRMLRIVLGGVGVAGFPESTDKIPQSKSPSEPINNLDEYTVVTTDDTEFKDGGDSIRFDDFKIGEIISIHGLLKGTTLTASRVAKWD